MNNNLEQKPVDLMSELMDAITNATFWGTKMAISDDTLECLWAGQSIDGRKRAALLGKGAFPFEGASDLRIPVAREKVNELCAFCEEVYNKAEKKFMGVDSLDRIHAHKVNQFLRWQIENQMSVKSKRQLVLAREWMFAYGLAITSINWEREERWGLEKIDLDSFLALKEVPLDLWNAFVADPQGVYASISNINIPTEADVMIQHCFEIYSMIFSEDDTAFIDFFIKEFGLKKAEAKKAVKEFRENEYANLPFLRETLNAPSCEAFVPFRNIFFPVDTADLNDAPWIAVRNWYTEQEVRANTEWDDEFKEELLKQAGKTSTSVIDGLRPGSSGSDNRNKSIFLYMQNVKSRFEVFEFYYKNIIKGAVQVRRCVMSAHAIKEGNHILGVDAIYDEVLGAYPFIAWERQPTADALLSSEGIPYLIYTEQNAIKEMRDSRSDSTKMAVSPMVRRNVRDRGRPLVMGPGRVIDEGTMGSIDYVRPPENRNGQAIELENTTKLDVDRFVGAHNSQVPKEATALIQAGVARRYLEIMKEVITAIFKLNQLYLPDVVVTRVSGITPESFKMSKDEIQGSFDIYLGFDINDLDSKLVDAKIEAFVRLINLDVNSIVDRNMAVKLIASVIDPVWAESIITDEQMGSLREIVDEQNNVALMMTGQEPQKKDKGQNFSMRLNYLKMLLEKSPTVQEKISTDQTINTLFQNRIGHLEFQVQQIENARIGRLGTADVL